MTYSVQNSLNPAFSMLAQQPQSLALTPAMQSVLAKWSLEIQKTEAKLFPYRVTGDYPKLSILKGDLPSPSYVSLIIFREQKYVGKLTVLYEDYERKYLFFNYMSYNIPSSVFAQNQVIQFKLRELEPFLCYLNAITCIDPSLSNKLVHEYQIITGQNVTMEDLLPYCTNLQSIILPPNQTHLITWIKESFTNLNSIVLQDCSSLDDFFLFGGPFMRLNSLTLLKANQITDDFFIRLAEKLLDLKFLKIEGAYLTGENFDCLLKFPNFEGLFFENMTIPNYFLEDLCVLREKVKYLTFKNCYFYDEKDLLTLDSCKKLKQLAVEGVFVEENTAVDLMESLQDTTFLLSINEIDG